jgi:hypothetical protein
MLHVNDSTLLCYTVATYSRLYLDSLLSPGVFEAGSCLLEFCHLSTDDRGVFESMRFKFIIEKWLVVYCPICGIPCDPSTPSTRSHLCGLTAKLADIIVPIFRQEEISCPTSRDRPIVVLIVWS